MHEVREHILSFYIGRVMLLSVPRHFLHLNMVYMRDLSSHPIHIYNWNSFAISTLYDPITKELMLGAPHITKDAEAEADLFLFVVKGLARLGNS